MRLGIWSVVWSTWGRHRESEGERERKSKRIRNGAFWGGERGGRKGSVVFFDWGKKEEGEERRGRANVNANKEEGEQKEQQDSSGR